ncbi:MAG: HAD domain-containing protein [Polyangiales bacterium]
MRSLPAVRVLFLDFDGVLNSDRFDAEAPPAPEGEGWWGPSALDPRALERLRVLVRRAGCQVVVSSTWRLNHSREALSALLGLVVADITPRLHRTPDGVRQTRGDEIRAWLEAHPEVSTWVAVDDDIVDVAFFVRTDAAVGLTDEDVERLVERLGA